MAVTLEMLLRRIRDGQADAAELEEARRLAAHDDRLPETLRGEVLRDEVEAEAAALLAVLGEDELLGHALQEAIAAEIDDAVPVEATDDAWAALGAAMAEGLAEEAQGVDLAGEIAEALDLPALPVGEAVRAEAGEPGDLVGGMDLPHVDVAGAVYAEAGRVDLSPVVMAALAVEVLDVAAAVRAEAGGVPDVAPTVLGELGLEHPADQLAAAVRAEAGTVRVADEVMATLEQSRLPLAEAVRTEAGPGPGLAGVQAVMEALGVEVAPVAEAVRAEAGAVDVADRVAQTLSPEVLAGLLDHQLDATTHRLAAAAVDEDRRGSELTAMADLGRDLRSALYAEAGRAPTIWGQVAAAIGIEEPERVEGWDERQLSEAVRSEAGSVDVVDAVMEEVCRPAPRSMPLAEVPLESLPPVANGRTWGLTGLLVAAMALFAVFVGPLLGGDLGLDDQGLRPSALTFASAQDLVVEELEYADGVQVFQTEGEGGAVIIWFDEGAML